MGYRRPNFEEMLNHVEGILANFVPDQLEVSQSQIRKLKQIHPATLAEVEFEDGDFLCAIVIPTTEKVMNLFLQGDLSEQQLLRRTKPGEHYDCLYLCSVEIVSEALNSDEIKLLYANAISAIVKDHNIKTLFMWPFTKNDEEMAQSLSNIRNLPLRKGSV